ncbi:MAG: MFS transporter [Christensenellaceae bacterium]
MKLTKQERDWILYDVGNSAFIMLVSTILPIFFKYLYSLEFGDGSDNAAMVPWGYATSIATVITAVIAPVMGAIADFSKKKAFLFGSMLVGVIACCGMAIPMNWFVFLIVFVIAKVGYSASLVFYDSMLTDVTTKERMDDVSSRGYAWGYIGSCIPFVLSIVVVLGLNLDIRISMAIAFVINAVWWFLCTMPMMKSYRQKFFLTAAESHPVRDAFAQIGRGLKIIWQDKKVFFFLLAFFFYIDGVYTIIDMATSFGSDLGFDSVNLLLALLLTQIVAFPSAIAFGKLAKKYNNQILILISIAAYAGIATFAIFLYHAWQFWLLAGCVGLFQGGIQALSRSYFAKIIPEEHSGECFGVYDIFGKGAAFLGTFLVSLITDFTHDSHIGISVLVVFFVLGAIFFWISTKYAKKDETKRSPEAGE